MLSPALHNNSGKAKNGQLDVIFRWLIFLTTSERVTLKHTTGQPLFDYKLKFLMHLQAVMYAQLCDILLFNFVCS